MEEKVQELERTWAVIQERALKQPSPVTSLTSTLAVFSNFLHVLTQDISV